jgi:methylglutaconyl-CoA hydratase
MTYKFIQLIEQKGSVTLWLNRPEKRNAFHHEMVLEILDAIEYVNGLPDDTILLLQGKGDVFCAGADLGWMYNAKNLTQDQNYAECLDISRMYNALYLCNKVTLAVVHGAAVGGGAGLVAACDIAVCYENTKFALSELRIGVVAACISPYLVKKMGESRTKELVFTSLSFKGKDAEEYGLVNRSVAKIGVNSIVQNYISQIKLGSASARKQSKELIHSFSSETIGQNFVEKTAKILADVRVSDDARDRMALFLKK